MGLLSDLGECFGESLETKFPLSCRDELDVFIGEVESGFEVGEQFDELSAELCQRFRESSGELPECDFQSGVVFGLDHSQHGFGLDQVDPPGQEGSECKFTGPGGSHGWCLVCEQFFEQFLEYGG